MVAAFRKYLNSAPGLVAAAIVALMAALAAALLPDWRFARLVIDSGLPSILPPAAPPLGLTARLLFIAVAAGASGIATWVAARYLLPVGSTPTTARRADAHPDAPLREPVKAMRDLGAPFLDTPPIAQEPAERPVPGDLDQPLAAFDPAAIPERPQTPSVAVMPLYRPTPPNDPVPLWSRPIDAAPNGPRLWVETPGKPAPLPSNPTIDSMIERLEQGLSHRGRPSPGARAELDALLATLRGIAAPR